MTEMQIIIKIENMKRIAEKAEADYQKACQYRVKTGKGQRACTKLARLAYSTYNDYYQAAQAVGLE